MFVFNNLVVFELHSLDVRSITKTQGDAARSVRRVVDKDLDITIFRQRLIIGTAWSCMRFGGFGSTTFHHTTCAHHLVDYVFLIVICIHYYGCAYWHRNTSDINNEWPSKTVWLKQ